MLAYHISTPAVGNSPNLLLERVSMRNRASEYVIVPLWHTGPSTLLDENISAWK